MKSVFLVVLLAAAATAAVVSSEVPVVVELLDVADDDEVADVDMNEMPEVVVTDVNELANVAGKTAVASRRNLSLGTIGPLDLRMYNVEHRANAIAGQTQIRDITVRANERINAIRVTRIGNSQNATPSVVGGGIGNSFVIIRIQSAVGRGYDYRVEVYGT